MSDEIDRLRTALESLRRKHYVCDDCWYSCPQSGESCNGSPDKRCSCGAEAANAIIDKALGTVEAGATAPAPE